MRIIQNVVLVVVLVAIAGCSTPKGTKEWPFRVQVQALPVQEEPSMFSDSIGELEYKQPVTIVGSRGDWYKVQVEGWIRKAGVTQGSLESGPKSVQAFGSMVDDVKKFLTNGVNNTQSPKRR